MRRRMADYLDIVAGTSTGVIIPLLLAVGIRTSASQGTHC